MFILKSEIIFRTTKYISTNCMGTSEMGTTEMTIVDMGYAFGYHKNGLKKRVIT